MRLKISHTTQYDFHDPVSYGLQQLRKTPKDGQNQRVLSWATEASGAKKELSFSDHHGNRVDLISIPTGTTKMTVRSTGEVEVMETHGVVGRHRGPAPLWLYLGGTARTECGAGCAELVAGIRGGSDLDRLHALSGAVLDRVAYEIGATDAQGSAEDAIVAGRGVCQDHTHIFIACARALGYPARYVSGYLMLNDRVAQEAAHAWAEAHIDALGWVGFDVSNGISPDTRYVRVATGLDYAQAAPVTGTRQGGGGERLAVQIEVAQQ